MGGFLFARETVMVKTSLKWLPFAAIVALVLGWAVDRSLLASQANVLRRETNELRRNVVALESQIRMTTDAIRLRATSWRHHPTKTCWSSKTPTT